MGVSQNSVYLFGGPKKDCSILGSILGSLYLRKLPYTKIATMAKMLMMIDEVKKQIR